MKKIIVFFVFYFITNAVQSQNWDSNISSAVKNASQKNKKILLYFTVDNQCEICTKLEQNIFNSDVFIAFANENYILVKIKFDHNSSVNLPEEEVQKKLLIVEKYNKDGFFPLVVLLNKEAKKLGNIDVYKNETPNQYIAFLRKFEK
jgi:thioredoxin-related protein